MCKSLTTQSQSVLHTEYLVVPVPSSILWMSFCFKNKDKLLEMVDLSTVSSEYSISDKLRAESDCSNSRIIKMRNAVGLTLFLASSLRRLIYSLCYSLIIYIVLIQK